MKVDIILTGNYLKEANTIRLNIELIDVDANEMIWREPIEVEYENVFALQDIVSAKVIDRLKLQFSQDERARMQNDVSQNPLAYEYYLRSLSYPEDAEGNRLAVNMLRQSIELDSTFAPAWGALGRRTALMGYWELGGKEMSEQAKDFYLKALETNPDLFSALAHLSMLYTEFGETDLAMETAQRMLEVGNVGAGGSTASGRAYVTWVGSQMGLMLATFDASGNVVQSPQAVANSVQISPNRLAGTDAGILIAHIWDTNPYWDPRVLEVDTSGNVVGLEVAENVPAPEQTLGVSVSATSEGRHAVVYVTSDTREVRMRRYDGTGPVDPLPVFVSGDAAPVPPYSALFTQVPSPFIMAAFAYTPSGPSPDVRFFHAPLGPGPVTVGPVLSDLVPGFAGSVSDFDFSALSGGTYAVFLWQEVEREDPNTCGCSVPQPIRVEFFAQLIAAGTSPTAVGAPQSVYLWQVGDPIGPPKTVPLLAPSGVTPGSYTVVWSDDQLRYTTVDAFPVTGVDPRVPVLDDVRLSSFPNPFSTSITISYELPRRGQVDLTIVDVSGKIVARLLSGEAVSKSGSITWNRIGRADSRLPSGVYFARLEFEGGVTARKLVVVR